MKTREIKPTKPELREIALRPVVDSGMVSYFTPALHVKTGRLQNLIQGIQKKYAAFLGYKDPDATTEQGSASAASPSIYGFSLYQLRYERRAWIEECREAFDDDPRIMKSVHMYSGEAVRGGCVITVNGTGSRGTAGQQNIKLKNLAVKAQNLINPLLESWMTMLLVEGDLFIQAIVTNDGQIHKFKRMPAAGIERNTDDTDEFVDPYHAFSQVDILTNEEVATFPSAIMYHARWNHVDGEKYGKPEIVTIRRARRLLMLCEDAQARRRIVRAPQRINWKIGTADKPTVDAKVIENFKEKNGFVNGVRQQFDPVEIGRDVFTNGLVDAQVIEGDQHISEIDDLKYLQNLVQTGCPTPAVLYNLDAASMGPGTFENIRAEWLKQTQRGTNIIRDLVEWAFDLILLLNGVLPETVDYSVRFSESTIETASSMIERAMKARQNTVGAGKNAFPDPLISKKTAIKAIAEHYDIYDVDVEMALIKQEMQDTAEFNAQMSVSQAEPMLQLQNEYAPDPVTGKAPTKPRNNSRGAGPRGTGTKNGNGDRQSVASKQNLPTKTSGINTNGTSTNLNRSNGTNVKTNATNGNRPEVTSKKNNNANKVKLDAPGGNPTRTGIGQTAAPYTSEAFIPEENAYDPKPPRRGR